MTSTVEPSLNRISNLVCARPFRSGWYVQHTVLVHIAEERDAALDEIVCLHGIFQLKIHPTVVNNETYHETSLVNQINEENKIVKYHFLNYQMLKNDPNFP